MNVMRRFLFVCCLVLATNSNGQSVSVVEYYNQTLDAYFITGRANEQTILDSAAGFSRTGMTFSAVPASVSSLLGVPSVCRYYISLSNPFTSSHFYGMTGGDCEFVANSKPTGFTNEGFDFGLAKPIGGFCPSSAPYPVYRSFRPASNGKTPNHRYTVSTASYYKTMSSGWTGEGITFCSVAVTDAVSGLPFAGTPGGHWTGTTGTNRNVYAIVLPTGEAWVMYTDAGGNNYLTGVIYAQLNWSSGAIQSVTARDFSFEYRTFYDVRVSGSFAPRSSFAGGVTYPSLNQYSPFATRYSAALEPAANIATIAGSYTGTGLTLAGNAVTSVTIYSNGAVTGLTSLGCSFAGSTTPINGANAYRLTVTTSAGGACGSSLTLSGGIFYEPSSRSLNVITLDATRTNAYVFLGSKL